jgi:hypothetical protein
MTTEQMKPMSAEDAVKKAMEDHPTGLLVTRSEKQISAIYWTSNKLGEPVVAQNFITGLVQQSIDRGLFTKDELIRRINIVIRERKVEHEHGR